MFDTQADAPTTIGAPYEGFATIREIGPLGMVTLRCDPATPGLDDAVRGVAGTGLPGQRRIARSEGRAVAWMSPDEWLIVVPLTEVSSTLDALSAALGGAHHLAVDVSDVRCVFRIEGAKADQVLAKLCPVNLEALALDEIRRTRAAQVACAFWAQDDGFTLVAFRSVAAYVRGVLTHAAQKGSELRP